MKSPTITILDEVNCHLSNIPSSIFSVLKKELSFPVKGSFQTVAYQMGVWDGKESYIDDNGYTYCCFIDKIVQLLIEYGVPDFDIAYDDERPYDPFSIDVPLVDENLLKEETGFILRDYQVEGINKAISNRKGILGFATNAGKILINVGICKALDPYLKTISIVPNTHLVKQTAEEMAKTALSYAIINDKVKPDDRQEVINSHNHIIITKKLFLTAAPMFQNEEGLSNEYGFIYDEAHNFGDKMAEVMRFDMSASPIRIGMTGSFPSKDPNKATKIKCMMGNGILGSIKNHQLIRSGISSKPDITLISTDDSRFSKAFGGNPEWEDEFEYLKTNKHRVEAIKEYILSLPDKNTLILGHPVVVKKIAESINEDYITEEVSNDNRIASFHKFRTSDNHRLWASFDTSATGVSEDDILRLVFIDIGKNPTWILQGTGRGLRKSKKSDTVEIIDIHGNSKYSTRHKKERIKVYKQEKFDFEESLQIIRLKGETR